MKKLTYEFVKEQFEKEGYVLIDKKYKGSKTKLNYICPNGHKHNIKWSHWQRGQRCSYCDAQRKPTIGFIKKEFEKERYILLTKEYKNANQKLEYVCPDGHKYLISWANWKQGKRCAYCAGNGKLTIDFIKKEFEKENHTLLSIVYKNAHQKLNYICPNGHKHSISWANWQQGQRCYYCFGKVKSTIDFIRKEFEKEGYKLLTKSYVNNGQKLEYICPNGHKHSIRWNNWQQGNRCFECWRKEYGIKYSGEKSPSWKGGISCEPYCQDWTKEFKDFIKERDGYKCLNPNCWGNIHRLSVHHIDYNKKNCEPQNLITVCNSCNSRANTDRKWHTAWYQAIMYRRKTNGCNICKC